MQWAVEQLSCRAVEALISVDLMARFSTECLSSGQEMVAGGGGV
jgi:hypothetical protein